tara:strand:+ start:9851 stop:10441 length:591 start_codon:yes stop_codon:yes gene_type:complete
MYFDDHLLDLRYYSYKPLTRPQITKRLKMIGCHIFMNYRRKIFNKYFSILAQKCVKSLKESKVHIGSISYYDLKGGHGIIYSKSHDYVFIRNCLNRKYFNNYALINIPVVFWTKNGMAYNISPLVYNKSMKYRLGRVTKDGKHIYFKMNNSEYIIDAPYCKYRYRTPVLFSLVYNGNRASRIKYYNNRNKKYRKKY